MVEFLVKQGIDSISVNADVAKEISELVQKLENKEGVIKEQIDSKEATTSNKIEPIDNIQNIEKEIEEREESRKESSISKKENIFE